MPLHVARCRSPRSGPGGPGDPPRDRGQLPGAWKSHQSHQDTAASPRSSQPQLSLLSLVTSTPTASGASFEKMKKVKKRGGARSRWHFPSNEIPSAPSLKKDFQTRMRPQRRYSMLTDLSPPTKWGRGGGRCLLYGRRHFVRRRRRRGGRSPGCV